MKEISIIIASILLSVSIYVSSTIIANSNYALADNRPDYNFTIAKDLTMSIIEKADSLNQKSLEEVTDKSTATYQKVIKRLVEIEAEHYSK